MRVSEWFGWNLTIRFIDVNGPHDSLNQGFESSINIAADVSIVTFTRSSHTFKLQIPPDKSMVQNHDLPFWILLGFKVLGFNNGWVSKKVNSILMVNSISSSHISSFKYTPIAFKFSSFPCYRFSWRSTTKKRTRIHQICSKVHTTNFKDFLVWPVGIYNSFSWFHPSLKENYFLFLSTFSGSTLGFSRFLDHVSLFGAIFSAF